MCGAWRVRDPLPVRVRSFVIFKPPLYAIALQPLPSFSYGRLAPREIPEGRVRFVFLRPQRCQTKSHLLSQLARQLHMYVRVRTSVHLIVRSGAICTSPLHCSLQEWELGGDWAR